jgi:hypothetical protein
MSVLFQHCDFLGVYLKWGAATLRLLIDGDRVTDEGLIGRFALIHERAFDFRKYCSAVGGNKLPVHVQGMIFFSAHTRAEQFWQRCADKCVHKSAWKSVFTKPWVFDLEAEKMKRVKQGIAHLYDFDGAKVEKAIFGAGHP